MNDTYDAVIVGAGVFGVWTAYHLQHAGWRVALVDAYGAGNSRASSGGESRIIRLGYGADEIYTRWSMRALELWREFASGLGYDLFHRTGMLWMTDGKAGHARDTLETFKKLGVGFEIIERDELESRYPQINFGQLRSAIYEPNSGVLMARRAVQSVARLVVKNGADFFIASICSPTGSGILNQVTTQSGGRLTGRYFVFACGPWLPKIFPGLLQNRIYPTKQEVFFFGPPAGDARFAPPQMPAWIDWGTEMYGAPDLENRGFKIALDRHGPHFDPDIGVRTITKETLDEVRDFMAVRFPLMKDAPLLESRVCQYENTSNGDFLIDHHPDFENVWLVGGGSGHGFKHGPALGEYVAARIVEGGEIDERFSYPFTGDSSRYS